LECFFPSRGSLIRVYTNLALNRRTSRFRNRNRNKALKKIGRHLVADIHLTTMSRPVGFDPYLSQQSKGSNAYRVDIDIPITPCPQRWHDDGSKPNACKSTAQQAFPFHCIVFPNLLHAILNKGKDVAQEPHPAFFNYTSFMIPRMVFVSYG